MRFSILVSVYNVERWLEPCLDSIFCQTFQDFELIAVDDGSTDGSGAILDRYAASRSNMKVIHQENQGLFVARLTAYKEAAGEYCIFCDSDDSLEPDALETLEPVITEHQPDILQYRIYMVKDGVKSEFDREWFPDGWITDREKLFQILLTTYELQSMCKKAIRRELLDCSLNPEKYRHRNFGEDFLYSVPLFVRAKKIYNLNRQLYNYRVTTGMMQHFREDYYREYRRCNMEVRPALKKEGLVDWETLLGVHLMHAAYGAFHQCAYLTPPSVASVKEPAGDSCFRKSFLKVRYSECWSGISRHERLVLLLIYRKCYPVLSFLIRMIKRIKRL